MTKVRAIHFVVATILVASPLVAQADSGFYGSLRLGLAYSDPGGIEDSSVTFSNWASRAGFSGETDIENGLTAFGKIEFGVDTGSSANGNGALSTRLAYVGLKGDFGTLTLGQKYHSWYNAVIAPVDQPWWGSCNGCLAYSGRVENGLTYSNDFGGANISATIHMRDELADGSFEDDIDGMEVGATFTASGLNFGVGFRDWDNGTEPAIGASVTGTAGDIGYAANVAQQDGADGADDALGVDVFLSYGNAYLDVGMINAEDTSNGFTLGYTHSIGTNTSSWFELQRSDSGADGVDAAVALRAALKYDWN